MTELTTTPYLPGERIYTIYEIQATLYVGVANYLYNFTLDETTPGVLTQFNNLYISGANGVVVSPDGSFGYTISDNPSVYDLVRSGIKQVNGVPNPAIAKANFYGDIILQSGNEYGVQFIRFVYVHGMFI